MPMNVSTSISRVSSYYTRQGFWATIRRAGLAARRTLLSNRMALFYCDLARQRSSGSASPKSLAIERKRNEGELSKRDLEDITSFWNPTLAVRNVKERFGNGATLWLIRSEGRLAGYGWTLTGRTIEPHYFRLGTNDVHLFDFHVFPQYRGRGLNPSLVTHILYTLSMEGMSRAFIEAAEWNQAQLLSLSKTPFRPLAWGRKLPILGGTLVWWSPESPRR